MKDFLLIANINCITYKEFFPMLKEDKARPGYVFNKTLEFDTPNNTTESKCGIAWYTTFPVIHKHLVLTKTYNPQDFQVYDNYDAINVDRVKDIPYDYDGVMGVPITIFGYDLDNVEVEGIWNDKREEADFIVKGTPTYLDEKHKSFQGQVVDGKAKYSRVVIKKNFEIDGCLYGDHTIIDGTYIKGHTPEIEGKHKYARILIKHTPPWKPLTPGNNQPTTPGNPQTPGEKPLTPGE